MLSSQDDKRNSHDRFSTCKNLLELHIHPLTAEAITGLLVAQINESLLPYNTDVNTVIGVDVLSKIAQSINKPTQDLTTCQEVLRIAFKNFNLHRVNES